jgi:uncharacterized protein YjbI with pentapeptide repeats
MGKNDHEDDFPENKEDFDNDENDEDEKYDEFSPEQLDKDHIKKTGEIFIEGKEIRDFPALVLRAQEHNASLNLENCSLYGTRLQGISINMRLDEVSFMEALNCSGQTVSGNLTFDDVGFGENVDFGSTVFEKSVSFVDCNFGGLVNFAECRFEGDVSFQDSEFEGESSFSGANFKGNVNLTSATFEKMVSFKDAVFESSVNLRRVDFDAGVDKTGSNIDNLTGEDSSDDDRVENLVETKSKGTQPGISLCMIVKNELENLKKNLSPLLD